MQQRSMKVSPLFIVMKLFSIKELLSIDQINLADAGCISRLCEILATTDNDTTRCKVLLALNNLALNETTITHFLV